MSIAFESPRYLWLLLLTLPMALTGIAMFAGMSGSRKASAILLRIGLFALIAAMLAGISSIRITGKMAVVAVIDVSGSVQAFGSTQPDGRTPPVSAMQRVRQYLKSVAGARGVEDLLGIVVFDGSTTAIAAPQPGTGARAVAADEDRPTDLLDRTWETITPVAGATDIAAALRLAGAMIPADATGRVVLFSDGNQTSGDALAAARIVSSALGPNSVPIDVLPLRYAITNEVIVDSVDAPARAAAGAVMDVRVNMRATQAVTGVVRLLVNGQEALNADGVASRRVTIGAGASTVLMSLTLPPGRVHRIEAVFEPDGAALAADTIADNNRAQSFTLTPGAGEVLVIQPAQGTDPGPLVDMLRSSGIVVQEIAAEACPDDLLKLQAFDAIILNNAPAETFNPAALLAIQRYVTETGGGLAMIGGTDSFGAGAWRGSSIEPILPVKLDLPDQVVMPAVAVMIVMDTSGSMGWSVMGSARTQQEIANEGAAIAVRSSLQRDDLVGVIEFNSFHSIVVPLAKNSDPEATAQRILGLSPGGGTNLPPALRAAYEQLRDARASVKHCVVLSDGMSMRKEALPEIVRSMKADGISVSTIAVGDKADLSMMEQMAGLGGGQYYRVTDPTTLPRIFVHAVKVVRTPSIREEPFTPIVTATGSPITAGLPAGMPALGGLVLTAPRPEKENNLPTGVTYAMLTPQGEPVLAVWQAGLGQVAAFTSDAGKWAREWIPWPGYRQMWTQLVRAISRPDASRAGELVLRRDGDEVVATLDLADRAGRPRDGVEVTGSVYAPDGSRKAIRLQQIGPGQYEGRSPVADAGSTVFTLTPKDGDTRLPPIVAGFVQPPGSEYRTLSSNETLLRQIAASSGGRVLELDAPADARLFDRSTLKPREARLPLWPLLILWAVGAMLADVATRRIAWDRLISRKFGAVMLKEAAAGTQDRSTQAARAVKTLREVEKAPADAGQKALSRDDAQRLVDEARQRRIAARAAAREGRAAESTSAASSSTTQQTPQSTPRAAPAPSQPAPSATKPIEKPPENETPLQAAKRRARERTQGEG